MGSIFSSLVAIFATFIAVVSGSPIPMDNPIAPVVEQVTSYSNIPSVATSSTKTSAITSERPPEVKIGQKITPAHIYIPTPEPVPQVIPALPAEPKPVQPAPPAEVRYYTNEKGEITDETGKVFWSPPKPIVVPTPTTTPVVVDEFEACGYEVALGLPLGSKCPPSSDPFPCYPNQPWTCRPTPFQKTTNGVPSSPVYQGNSKPNPRNPDGSLKKPCPEGVFQQKWCYN